MTTRLPGQPRAVKRKPGCAGCGAINHNVAGCLTEGAARHFELSGLPGTAARIRRQVAALAKSREVRRDEIRERAEARKP